LSAVSTVANGTQLTTGTGKLSGTIPSTATPLRVIGWTQSITVATAASGIGVAIPSGFTNALMSVVGTYANEQTSGVGLRVVIDTNGSATDSFKAWIYNAAGTRVATTGVFSFVAVGY
jgi:type 1 fimbria pilin